MADDPVPGVATPENERLAALRRELERCPFHGVLGVEEIAADPDHVVVRLPYRPELGLSMEGCAFHGGVLASLIDIAGHAAAAIRLGRPAPTVDLRVDYLRKAVGDHVDASARVLRAGRSVTRVDVEVRCPSGVLVACGRGTFSSASTLLGPPGG